MLRTANKTVADLGEGAGLPPYLLIFRLKSRLADILRLPKLFLRADPLTSRSGSATAKHRPINLLSRLIPLGGGTPEGRFPTA